MAKETFEFQAETQQLLDLMVHSIYTNHEIFLRELISNASDAIDKLHFESLTNNELLEGDANFEIHLVPDEQNHTLTISDNGIGMNRKEVIEDIGTIAKSGTKAFLAKLKEARESNTEITDKEMIGQFGVGFYSAFMVADNVTIVTRKAGETEAVRWESTGDGKYSIEACEKEKHAPFNLYYSDYEPGIQLYSRHVFIMDKCKDLLPDYLRFVKGLVDSPDLSLNISRELLQQSRELKIIGRNLEKNILKTLERTMTTVPNSSVVTVAACLRSL